MNIVDIILDKRYGRELSDEQIAFFVNGVTNKTIPDYQISALLMAIVLNGMNEREMTTLTISMADSGIKNDLSYVGGIAVDKHSTGGVGDKITPIVLPLCRTFGVNSVKLSGRGLGFTGGTVDKFASITGFNIDVPKEDFPRLVNDVGMVISGQTPDLAPADKVLYALRDVTGTVDSIPLIASSIMSKKIAGGAGAIVLDVTCGSGAFMKEVDRAKELAVAMIKIGNLARRRTVAVITDMDQPLGLTCGNIIEMHEVYEVLNGRGTSDVIEVASNIGAWMVKLAGKNGALEGESLVNECKARIMDGRVLNEYIKLIKSQGGVIGSNGEPVYQDECNMVYEVKASQTGYIGAIAADVIGHASVQLGSGRIKKDDEIDFGAGISFEKKRGDAVIEGETICKLYLGSKTKLVDKTETIKRVEQMVLSAYKISSSKPDEVCAVIDILGV
ncbi:MAG: thymidine phosphorylase [Saccharofermentans sp.]|nr:thymidine phosphorylase [Saccharofermentans sp.]